MLTDGTTHKRNKILLVPHNTVISRTTEKNVIKVATKKHKDKLYFKRESIDTSNIIEGKRGTRANQVLLKPYSKSFIRVCAGTVRLNLGDFLMSD